MKWFIASTYSAGNVIVRAKNKNESRIRYLEKMVKTAIVIEDTSQDDEVGINKVVSLYFEEDDQVEEFKIVTTVRGNSLKNLVSTESPIGKAVLGHKVGDKCWVAIIVICILILTYIVEKFILKNIFFIEILS